MIISEVNEGPKIPFEVVGNKVFFNDELMLNLEKYERDDDQSIDICENENFALEMGLGRKYVAQIKIPARRYAETTVTVEVLDDESGELTEEDQVTKEPVPFDMDLVELNLWGLV